MRRLTKWALVAVLTIGVAGCAAKSEPAPATQPAAGQPAPVVGAAIPPDSPLAKVKLGMTKGQVREALGSPTDENSYATGKVWIPFYFGNDARRTSWYYKGMGRVVFADGNAFGGGGNEVIRVDYDPAEPGYPRR